MYTSSRELELKSEQVNQSTMNANEQLMKPVGTVYSAQGFESDHIGVIFGNHLIYESEKQQWRGVSQTSHDAQIKRNNPDLARHLHNVYRVPYPSNEWLHSMTRSSWKLRWWVRSLRRTCSPFPARMGRRIKAVLANRRLADSPTRGWPRAVGPGSKRHSDSSFGPGEGSVHELLRL